MSPSVRSALDPQRRASLFAAKLRSLVSEGWGVDSHTVREPGDLPGGAALFDRGQRRAWVLVEENPASALGRALTWATRPDVGGPMLRVDGESVDLQVIIPAARGEDAPSRTNSGSAAVVARQAGEFRTPITVWAVSEAHLHQADPAPRHVAQPAPAGIESLIELMSTHGLTVRVDHGTLIGEWLGLEVARVVIDPDGSPHLEVGVGRNDREAFTMVHGLLPTPEAVAMVVARVKRYRSASDLTSPLTRLARERWLLATLVLDGAPVGADSIEPVENTLPSESVNDVVPAVGIGRSVVDGGPIVVACTAGIDVGLVPSVADARLAYAPGRPLVLAMAGHDRAPLTDRLNSLLRQPAEIRVVPVPWQGR